MNMTYSVQAGVETKEGKNRLLYYVTVSEL
jgi:hypothetical protein